jgi:GTP-binding protein
MKSLPRVAIVGFPNVGKSTLFNRLLGRKEALVHSLPGMTRDAVSALGELRGKRYILTDTGGLYDPSEAPLSEAVAQKAWGAARKADVVLLVLDSKRDLAPAEEELFFLLRKLGRPVVVVLNKVDSELQESRLGDYFNRLKTEAIVAVAAENRRNLDELEEALAALLPAAPPELESLRPLRVAIIGRINVGKSSLINRLSGEERLIVSSAPGTTRDSTDTYVVRNKKVFCLVDTAGVRRLSRTRDEREKAGIIRAKKDIGRADVLCQVLDAGEFPTRQDMTIAHLAFESGKPLVLALNKWDLIQKGESPEVIKRSVFRAMPFVSYAPLIFVSALTGKGVVRILDQAEEVYERAPGRSKPTG